MGHEDKMNKGKPYIYFYPMVIHKATRRIKDGF
jgi:hypothetical protein